MKNLLLLLAFLLFFINLNAQQISNELLSNSGQSSKNEVMQLDWSLGQIASSTVVQNDLMLTQGFHQPYKITIIKEENTTSPLSDMIRIWPNPTQSNLVVDLKNLTDKNIYVSVMDISGNKINRISSDNNTERMNINLENLIPGVYIIQVFDTAGILLEQQKVVKSN